MKKGNKVLIKSKSSFISSSSSSSSDSSSSSSSDSDFHRLPKPDPYDINARRKSKSFVFDILPKKDSSLMKPGGGVNRLAIKSQNNLIDSGRSKSKPEFSSGNAKLNLAILREKFSQLKCKYLSEIIE